MPPKKKTTQIFALHKNPDYVVKSEAKRKRWRPLKQIMDSVLASRQSSTAQNGKKQKKALSSEVILEPETQCLQFEPQPYDYVSLASMMPGRPMQSHWCDVTGLPSEYRCPRTRLYYFDKDVYAWIKQISMQKVQALLSMRGAGVNI